MDMHACALYYHFEPFMCKNLAASHHERLDCYFTYVYMTYHASMSIVHEDNSDLLFVCITYICMYVCCPVCTGLLFVLHL